MLLRVAFMYRIDVDKATDFASPTLRWRDNSSTLRWRDSSSTLQSRDSSATLRSRDSPSTLRWRDSSTHTPVGIWEDLKVCFDKFWWAAGEGSAICVLLFVSVGISIGLGVTVGTVTASVLTTANYGVVGYPTERDIFEAALTVRPEAPVGSILFVLHFH